MVWSTADYLSNQVRYMFRIQINGVRVTTFHNLQSKIRLPVRFRCYVLLDCRHEASLFSHGLDDESSRCVTRYENDNTL
eukprot:9198810-Pyramimonas_sp.AAC.1